MLFEWVNVELMNSILWLQGNSCGSALDHAPGTVAAVVPVHHRPQDWQYRRGQMWRWRLWACLSRPRVFPAVGSNGRHVRGSSAFSCGRPSCSGDLPTSAGSLGPACSSSCRHRCCSWVDVSTKSFQRDCRSNKKAKHYSLGLWKSFLHFAGLIIDKTSNKCPSALYLDKKINKLLKCHNVFVPFLTY